MKTPDDQLLSHGPIPRAIGSIAIPMLIMMLTAISFNWLDAWYISRLGEAELTAIDIAFPLITFSSSIIFGGVGTGVSAAIAAYHASKDKASKVLALRYGLGLALLIAFIITLVITFGGRQLLAMQNDDPAILELSYTYCFWYFLLFPVMAIGSTISAAMRGTGNAARPMVFSIIAMITDAILTPLFTYSVEASWYSGLFLGLGIKGAALSTNVSYIVLTLLLLWDVRREKQGLDFSTPTNAHPDKQKILKRILSTSLIAALVPMITNLIIGFSQSLLARRGTAILDAFSLSKRFEQFLIMLCIPVCAATMITISASHSHGLHERIQQTLKYSIKLLVTCSVVLSVFMYFGSDLWFKAFTPKAEILAEGARYFGHAFLHIVFLPLTLLINFSFQGISKPARPLPISISSIILFQGLACYLIISQNFATSTYYSLLSLSTPLTFYLCYLLFKRQSVIKG